MTAERRCKWCERPIASTARRDSVYCSQRCRQAAHRFNRDARHRTVEGAPAMPMTFCYLDPPYPGLADYYEGHPDYAGEVDHEAMLAQVVEDAFDGWALSTSSRSLGYVLGICHDLGIDDVRVASWHRGARGRQRSRRPVQSWEPVLYSGGREFGEQRLDSLSYVSRPRLTDPRRVIGAKPATFARWVFELLGAAPGDTLVDRFPGSGGILRAWEAFTMAKPDASARAAPDASARDLGDASPLEPVDASQSDPPDASLSDRRHASALQELDASPEYFGDTSHLDRGDR